MSSSSVAPIVVANGSNTASVWAFRQTTQPGGGGGDSGGGVTQLVPGTNVTLNPPSGLGVVQINVTSGGDVGPVLDGITDINAPLTNEGLITIQTGGCQIEMTGSGVDQGVNINSTGAMIFNSTTHQFTGEISASALKTPNVDVLGGGTTGFRQQLQNILLDQPIIQYDTIIGLDGDTGTTNVNLPIAYNTTKYVVHVTMGDASPAKLYAEIQNQLSFVIGWSGAGVSSNHTIMWTTYGR